MAVRHPAAQSGGRANPPPTEWVSAEIVGADSRVALAAMLLTRESRNIAAATLLALASVSVPVSSAQGWPSSDRFDPPNRSDWESSAASS